MYVKVDATIYETYVCIKLRFQHIGLNLQKNQVHHSREPKIRVLKQHYDFPFTLYLNMNSAFEGQWNTNKPVLIYLMSIHTIYYIYTVTNELSYPQKKQLTFVTPILV
jgi:hypothetical protein